MLRLSCDRCGAHVELANGDDPPAEWFAVEITHHGHDNLVVLCSDACLVETLRGLADSFERSAAVHRARADTPKGN